MYQSGDLVVYGNNGVCLVESVITREFDKSKDKQLYYVLKPLYQTCKIFSPVDNPKVFMRPVISADEAERLIALIPSIKAEAYHNHVLRELTEHYENSINSHDCEDLIELTMSIYAKKRYAEQQNRRFGQIDERFMKRAEDLLFGELAVALEISKEQVQNYIANKLEQDVDKE